MMFTLQSYPPDNIIFYLTLKQLMSSVCIPVNLYVFTFIRKSQIAIYLSWPPLTHTSLFLNAKSSTPSCPSNTDDGFIEFELMTEPSYLLVGAPPSRSKSSIFGPDAVMILMRDGANLIA